MTPRSQSASPLTPGVPSGLSQATRELLLAAEQADTVEIIKALSRGADPHARNAAGSTPLMAALSASLRPARDNDLRILACAAALIPLSDLSAIQHGSMSLSLLAMAARSRHAKYQLVDVFLRAGCSEIDPRPGSFTALMAATLSDDDLLLRTLIPFSCVDAQDFRGSTALILACGHDAERCFDLLLPLSNLDLLDDHEFNALDICESLTSASAPLMADRLRAAMLARELGGIVVHAPPGRAAPRV